MTEREEQAIEALIEAGSATDPFADPVQHMGQKLQFPNTAEARTFAYGLVARKLAQFVAAAPANDMLETGHVVPMRFAWEKFDTEK